MNQKDFNPDFNDDDLLVDMTFKVVKFIFTIVAVLGYSLYLVEYHRIVKIMKNILQ